MSSFPRWHHQGPATSTTLVSSAPGGGSAGPLTYFSGWCQSGQPSQRGRTSLQLWLPWEDPQGWLQCDNSLTKQIYFTKLPNSSLLWWADFLGKWNTKSVCKCGCFSVPPSNPEKARVDDFQKDPTPRPNLFTNIAVTRNPAWSLSDTLSYGCY